MIATIRFSKYAHGEGTITEVLDRTEIDVLADVNKWRGMNKTTSILGISVTRHYTGISEDFNGVKAVIVYETT